MGRCRHVRSSRYGSRYAGCSTRCHASSTAQCPSRYLQPRYVIALALSSPSRTRIADIALLASELLVDMIAYGTIIGGICLSSFVLVIWGFGGGDLGAGGCNDSRDGCEVVFRARATCFAAVSWTCLLLAWEMVDMRRSLFWMHPRTNTPYTQWMKDLWANQVLFWVRTRLFPPSQVSAAHLAV